MKNIALLSLSLVVVSGGAGLGLSALHEFNMNVQTSALATPDNIPADSGFVIPDHVPNAAQFATLAPSLPAPDVVDTPAFAPIETAALGDIELDQIESPNDEPDVPTVVRVSPRAVPVQVERRTGQDVDVRKAPKAVVRKTPNIVARAPALIQAPSVVQARLDYVIGVYR